MSSIPPTEEDDDNDNDTHHHHRDDNSSPTGSFPSLFLKTAEIADQKDPPSNPLDEQQPSLKEDYLQLPSYGSCPSQLHHRHPPSLPQASSFSNLLMESITTTDISAFSPNNKSSSPLSSPAAAASLNIETDNLHQAATDTAASDQDSAIPPATTIKQQEETHINNNNRHHQNANTILTMASAIPTLLTPLLHRLLRQTVLADKFAPYLILDALSTHARYAFLGFFAIYLLFVILIWIPLWLLGLLVTEWGVYAFLLVSLIYGGRCLLRLLAFPGTSVRVYGEIENEFAKYSCKMLEGGCGAVEDFAKALRSAGVEDGGKEEGSSAAAVGGKPFARLDENDGWNVLDVAATHKRAMVYKCRVLGVYLEVLHCLLEENGQGYDPYSPRAVGGEGTNNNGGGGRNGFYSLGKRNLCCERTACSNNNGANNDCEMQRSNNDAEGMALPTPPPPNHSPSNEILDGTSHSWTTTTATRYGNNPLVGDIGNMGNLTSQARSDGRELFELLTSLLHELSELESSSSNILRISDKKNQLKNAKLSQESMERANKLIHKARELREFISRIKIQPTDGDNTDNGDGDTQHDEEDVGAEAVRHRLEEQGGTASTTSTASGAGSSGSTVSMIRSAMRAFGSMIDPPPHESIFGLDVIRGSFLARYRGAKQFWVERSGSRGGDEGKLDVILIPSSARNANEGKNGSFESFLPLSPRKGRRDEIVTPSRSEDGGNLVGKRKVKAVLYCNPNAGLVEVATGMGLTGGNVTEDDEDSDENKEPTCWTEYYIENGYDVFLFNYAGYGRSFGGSSAWNKTTTEFSHGFWGALKRVMFSTFLAFKPSSESLKSDAAAVAHHLVDVIGVDELVIHGESIGGMAAAGAARALTASATTTSDAQPTEKSSTLLICDRTFCNLEAVAQRLVGQWTGNAIRLLTPMWSTDVARDFLAARCPKIVANDCADEIIHNHSSLKTGLAFAEELTKGLTDGVGWVMSAPLEYRMADLDNVGVANSRMVGTSCGSGRSCAVKNPPTWPADKHVSWSEAHHFAACVKRIGKLATAAKKRLRTSLSDGEEAEEGVEIAYSSGEGSPRAQMSLENTMQEESETMTLIKIWNFLACCDGLCGHPLGHAVKEGFDCTVAWLCCTVVFGSHVLAEKAEIRLDKQQQQTSTTLDALATGLGDGSHEVFLTEDFDLRPDGYQWDEDDLTKHPLPIPVVLSSLKEMTEMTAQKNPLTEEVETELNYVIGMLEYIISRLTSKESSALSLRRRSGLEYDEQGIISTGSFLNLHCGHNNQFSLEEREKLMALIRRSCGSDTV